ncbi:spindle pole body component 110-like [Leguminivora glycinivorella]|uniref:spindle pole body component 110-like n=1 Tax=Leguminivora glycinivorella TaxID=1035111 RepID=UPI00200D9569|nr:spindle pole body component 110-like [Leguminivora glycinivorella]
MTNVNLETLENLIKGLRIDLKKDLQESLNDIEAKLSKNIKELNEKLQDTYTNIRKDIENVKETNTNLDNKMCYIERQIRKRNVVFFGVEETENTYEELEKNIISIITETLKVDCNHLDLEIVRRIGIKNENKIRPVKVTLTTFGKKICILKKSSHLKRTNMYIKEDFTPQVLETRKLLQDQLQKAREEGKKAFIRHDKLIIKEPDNKQPVDRKKSPRNSKKRELEVTPPNQMASSYHRQESSKRQVAKKNKTQIENQNTILSYMKNTKNGLHTRSPSVTSIEDGET